MIREDLLDLRYYLNRLSEFMRESYGISGQMETFTALLEKANEAFDEIFEQLDFFHKAPEGSMLDKIAAIFGCQRRFTIAVQSQVSPLQISSYEQVDLSDEELLVYIKTQVIKQNFDGSRETLQKLYSTYVDGKIQPGLTDLVFLYMTENDEEGVCTIRWDKPDASPNLSKLFFNGYLTIESVGVLYRRYIEDFTNFSYYYKEEYYLLQGSAEPSDWDSAEEKYYKVEAILNSSPEWDDSKVYAKRNPQGYDIQSNQPSDWADAYGDYWVLSISAKEEGALFIEGAFATKSIAQNAVYFNRVYSKIDAEETPSDWSSGHYYKIASYSPSSQWDDSKIYGEADLGEGNPEEIVQIFHEPTSWPTMVNPPQGETPSMRYFEISEKDSADSYEAGEYYSAATEGGSYT